MAQTNERILCTFDRRILRAMFGRVMDRETLRRRY